MKNILRKLLTWLTRSDTLSRPPAASFNITELIGEPPYERQSWEWEQFLQNLEEANVDNEPNTAKLTKRLSDLQGSLEAGSMGLTAVNFWAELEVTVWLIKAGYRKNEDGVWANETRRKLMSDVKVGDRVVSSYGVEGDSWRGPGTVLKVNPPYTVVNLDNRNTAHLVDGEFELEFLKGDILRAERDETAHEGKLVTVWDGPEFAGQTLAFWKNAGFTVSLVRRPEPEIVLPTKPYAIVFAGGASHIRGAGGIWYRAFGKDDDGITSEQLLAKAKANKDYRVVFEGEAK